VPVSFLYVFPTWMEGRKVENRVADVVCGITGSGCIAALEAEKFLAEADAEVDNLLETENEATKSESNGVVPEYRSNPLL